MPNIKALNSRINGNMGANKFFNDMYLHTAFPGNEEEYVEQFTKDIQKATEQYRPIKLAVQELKGQQGIYIITLAAPTIQYIHEHRIEDTFLEGLLLEGIQGNDLRWTNWSRAGPHHTTLMDHFDLEQTDHLNLVQRIDYHINTNRRMGNQQHIFLGACKNKSILLLEGRMSQ